MVPAAAAMERANDASEVPEQVVELVGKVERERRAKLQARMEAIFAV